MAKIELKLLRALAEDEKLAPQAKVIVETVRQAVDVDGVIDREDLVAKLTDSGELNTRQDVGRVVAFYTPRLVEAGLIEVIKHAPDPAAVDETKPARKRKAKNDDGGPEEVAPEAVAS